VEVERYMWKEGLIISQKLIVTLNDGINDEWKLKGICGRRD